MKTASQPVFLVEDNSLYAKALEKHLNEHLSSRVPIHTFSNGEDCLKNLNMNPKIIVLDYFLNSASRTAMNGLDILKQIKLTNPETKVLMLSSQDDMEVTTDTMKYGAFEYVPKNKNAFLRIQNSIDNLEKIIPLRKESFGQSTEIKKAKQFLIASIMALAAVMVVLELFS